MAVQQVLGRAAELAALAAFLDRLPAGSEALALAGEAGAGKTTLLRAGAGLAAARGFTVLSTSPAPSELPLAFAGLSDLIEPHLPTVLAALPPPQARALQVARSVTRPLPPPGSGRWPPGCLTSGRAGSASAS